MKLNKKYVAPKATLTRVACESAICAASATNTKVIDNNGNVNISPQDGGAEFDVEGWG